MSGGGWIAAAQAGSSLIGGALGAYYNRRGQQRANAYNEEAARTANMMDAYRWGAETDYNKPWRQMNRLKKAGLNPHLMYGQGTVGNAGSAPTAQRPQFENTNIGNPFTDALANMNTMATNNNIKAQTAVQKEQALNLATDRINKEIKNTTDKARLEILQAQKDDLYKEAYWRIENMIDQNRKTDSEVTLNKMREDQVRQQTRESRYRGDSLKYDTYGKRILINAFESPQMKRMLKHLKEAGMIQELMNFK